MAKSVHLTGAIIPIEADTICVHGDNEAIELIAKIRAQLDA